jgi:hypothetical protein
MGSSASASKPALSASAAAAAAQQEEEEVMEEEQVVVVPEGWAPEEIPSSLVSALGANLTVQVRDEGRESEGSLSLYNSTWGSLHLILCTTRNGQDPSFVLACLEEWVSHTYHQVCGLRMCACVL